MEVQSIVKLIELGLVLGFIIAFGTMVILYWRLSIHAQTIELAFKEDQIKRSIDAMPLDDVVKLNNERNKPSGQGSTKG